MRPKGAKEQKIDREKQAWPLTRPHIDSASLRIACRRSRGPRCTQGARARENYCRGRILAARSRRALSGRERAADARTDRTPMTRRTRSFSAGDADRLPLLGEFSLDVVSLDCELLRSSQKPRSRIMQNVLAIFQAIYVNDILT